MDLTITNHAEEVPFSSIVQELIVGNVGQSALKQAAYEKLKGVVAIDLPDIEAAVTLIFQRGKLTIEAGITRNPAIVIKTSSDTVMDLNLLKIRFGIPYYFDSAGRRVLGHLLKGRLKIKGLFRHPVLLTRFTIIMSVM